MTEDKCYICDKIVLWSDVENEDAMTNYKGMTAHNKCWMGLK